MIQNLKITIKKIHTERIASEQEKNDLKEKNKFWKARAEAFEQDKNFLQDQVLESKRQNKLLKLSISRLQEELALKDSTLKSSKPPNQHNAEKNVGDTFVTAVKD